MYYFIGIKGSGMASLASILKDRGEEVSGSDIETYIFTQKKLEEHKIPFFPFSKDNIKDGMKVIIGASFDDAHEEVIAAKENTTIETFTYADFLGHLMNEYHSISVCGTHGKTTTTGMLAHVFSKKTPTGYLIGDGTGKMSQDATTFIVESCEYQRRFLSYTPDYAIILNMELDHVDYYKSEDDYIAAFQSFCHNVKRGIALFGDEKNTCNLKVSLPHIYYGEHDGNEVQAKNIIEDEKGLSFDCFYKGELFYHFVLPFYGRHLLWNALGVISIGILNDMNGAFLQRSLETFKGVQRRFNIEELGRNVYIDDYAHHPTAIALTIEAAKQKYPNKKLIAIFQPDRYSRIHYFLNDFSEAFKDADKVFLCPFPENAKKEDGIDITIDDLAKKVHSAIVVTMDDDGAQQIIVEEDAVYLFMSSKDIYKFKDRMKNFQKD